MKNFMDQKAWQKCHELVVAIYRLSASFPENDRGVMSEELRNTALLLQINIEDALMNRRRPVRGIPRSLDVANGKLARLESGLVSCKGIRYINSKTFKSLCAMAEDVQKDIHGMMGKRAVRSLHRWQERILEMEKASLSSSPA